MTTEEIVKALIRLEDEVMYVDPEELQARISALRLKILGIL